MSKLFTSRWGFGLGAAAGAAVLALCLFVATPRAQAKAAEVLARGAKAVAKLTSVHLTGQLRTLPADNFGMIAPDGPFFPIELWKQSEPGLKWRVEKPDRVAVMDGQSTVLFIKPVNSALKVAQATVGAFDTGWLYNLANLSQTITTELKNATAQGWKVSLDERNGADGRPKSIVTLITRSGLPEDDYLKNAFMDSADTRRVYRFDAQSELLEAVQVFVTRPAGEVEIFELTRIEYNQPIDANLWTLQLPADVTWMQPSENLAKLPDNEKYAAMTPQQAARAFFEACGRNDWVEAGKFTDIDKTVKAIYGGVTIVNLGEPFKSKSGFPGCFVPYEVKLRTGSVKKYNLAVRNDNAAGRWQVDGGY